MRIIVLLSALLIASPVLAGNAEQPPKTTKQPKKCGSGCSGVEPNCKCPSDKPAPPKTPFPA